MKRFITSTLLLLALLLPATAAANPITPQQAQQNALTFMEGKGKSFDTSALRHAPSRSSSVSTSAASYYVFNIGNNKGYVIASGDDCAPAILGYADSGHIDLDSLPENMKGWLEEYERQIQFMQEKGSPSFHQHELTSNLAPISPLLTTSWGQDYPYNQNCPDFFGYGKCITGCVATAMAQVMYYHRSNSVSQTTATIPAYTCSRLWDFGNGPQRISVDAIPAGSAIEWNAMKDSYDGLSTPMQRRAVANLMKYCGASVQMEYADSYNGGSTASTIRVPIALKTYFNYNNGTSLESRTSFSSDNEWNNLIYNELQHSRPVFYVGANSGSAHAFVCDGFDGAGFFHINWGWDGRFDGYFLLTALDPYGGTSGYNLGQEALINAFPKPSKPFDSPKISFADANVKALCVQYWDFDGDGELCKAEAALVSTLNDVFYNNRDITSFNELKFFTGLSRIGNNAFAGCTGLTSVTIPNSVTSIGSGAFFYCIGLTNIEIPSSVTEIGKDAFESSAWYNNLPDGLVYIGPIAYKYKGTMPDGTSVVIKNGTLSIASFAFQGCRGLTSVTIPSTVTSIGQYAFWNCRSLTSVTIPNSITSIDMGVFRACSSLTSVTIPYSVTSIGRDAFENCINLTSVTIPNSVTSIDIGAFRCCRGLTSVIIPNSITSICGSVFQDCSGLTSVTIPNSVTFIGYNAFYGCTSLMDIVVNSRNPKYDSRNNCNAIIETSSNTLILGCQNTVIPNSVTSIGNYAFARCTGLTSVNIPNTVIAIGIYAFGGCSGLTSMTIGNSVTSIGRDAFYGCSGLTSVIIPNSVTSISDYAFGNCSSLTSVAIGNSVTSIGDMAFAYCSGLTSVTIPNSVTSIGYSAFYGCSGMTSMSIPNSVTSIGYYAFVNCNGLRNVFSYITDLSKVTSGNSMFSVYVAGDNYDYSGRTLHVPHGTADAYQADENWYPYFGSIMEIVQGDVNCDLEVNIADVNATIDIILEGNGYSIIADVNGDSEINIADINTLIDLILTR